MNAVKLYSKFNSVQQFTNKSVIRKKLNLLDFKPQERIFEVGCGTGGSTKTFLKYIPHNYEKYVATDIYQGMIDHARAENTTNVQFDQFDIATQQPIKEEWLHAFHKVVSFCAINWVPMEKQLQCFNNINRLLKMNGTTLLVVIADVLKFDMMKELYKNPKWQPYFADANESISPFNKYVKNRRQILENILLKSNFEIIDVDAIHLVYKFESTDSFKNTMMALNPCASRMDVHLRDSYWNDAWKAVAKHSDILETGAFPIDLFSICVRKIQHIDS